MLDVTYGASSNLLPVCAKSKIKITSTVNTRNYNVFPHGSIGPHMIGLTMPYHTLPFRLCIVVTVGKLSGEIPSA